MLFDYLTVFKKFNTPLPFFFALIFKFIYQEPHRKRYNPSLNAEVFLNFLKTDRSYQLGINLKNQVLFCLINNEYVVNDVGISQSDFQLFQDILLKSSPVVISHQIFLGLLISEVASLQFRYRGQFTQEDLQEAIPDSILQLTSREQYIVDPHLKRSFKDEINLIKSQQKMLKFKK